MAFDMSINLNLGRIEATARRGAAKGLARAAEHVLGVSNQRVPIEEGTLEGSGATHVDPDALTAVISYDTPYAVVQHEDLTLKHDAGRQAKYLESALTGERQAVLKLIQQGIREEWGT